MINAKVESTYQSSTQVECTVCETYGYHRESAGVGDVKGVRDGGNNNRLRQHGEKEMDRMDSKMSQRKLVI